MAHSFENPQHAELFNAIVDKVYLIFQDAIKTNSDQTKTEITSVKNFSYGSLLYTGDVIVKEGKIIPHGNGSLSDGERVYYEGQFVNGRYHGEGKFNFGCDSRLKTFEGKLENDILVSGTYTLRNGDKLKFKDSKTLFSANDNEIEFTNGDKFIGKINSDYEIKEGIMNYNQGGRYTGSFENSKRHGKGVLIISGKTFDGEFANDEFIKEKYTGWNGEYECDSFVKTKINNYWIASGFCTYDSVSRTIIGMIVDDKINGEGTIIYKSDSYCYNKSKYEGNLVNDFPDGKGKLTFKDGSVYEGNFKHRDGRHGEGTMAYANGTTITGLWEKNYFVSITKKNEKINKELIDDRYSQ